MAEDLAAEIEHDLLAGPLHHVGLNELEAEDEGERGEIEEAELGDSVDGVGREVVGKPRMLAVGGIKIGVDGDFDEVGPEDVAGCLEDDGDSRDGDLELVRREIADEAAHEARVVDFADYVVVLLLGLLGVGLLLGHESLILPGEVRVQEELQTRRTQRYAKVRRRRERIRG